MPQAGGMPQGGQPPGQSPQMGGMQSGGQPAGGMQQRGQGQLDWRQLVQAVKQANPNLPPEVMAEAVNQFLPLMNATSQQEWKQISLQMREQQILQREQLATAAEAGRNSRAGTAEEGRNTRAGAAEEGRTERAGAAEEGRETRSARSDTRMKDRATQQAEQFQQREKRLEQGLKLREDSTWARLEQQKQAAAQRVEQSQGRQGLAEWKAAADAQDKHVRTRIQAYSQMNSQKPKERAEMLKAADETYNAQMEEFRSKYGRSTPGGGTAAPGAPDKPKVEDRVPLPPEAVKQLKEGQVTTFNNGQKWTLEGGQPKQVP